MRWHWQREWRPGGWRIIATYGQSFALGVGTGYSWIAARCNGVWISLGPITFDIIPPTPRWLREEIAAESSAKPTS